MENRHGRKCLRPDPSFLYGTFLEFIDPPIQQSKCNGALDKHEWININLAIKWHEPICDNIRKRE